MVGINVVGENVVVGVLVEFDDDIGTIVGVIILIDDGGILGASVVVVVGLVLFVGPVGCIITTPDDDVGAIVGIFGTTSDGVSGNATLGMVSSATTTIRYLSNVNIRMTEIIVVIVARCWYIIIMELFLLFFAL